MSEQKQPFDTKTRFCCLLAYVPFLFFLPLVFATKNPRAKFHANQGLVLLIAFLVINAVISVIDTFVTLPVALLKRIFLFTVLRLMPQNSAASAMLSISLSGNRSFSIAMQSRKPTFSRAIITPPQSAKSR